jgi:hypothetical protein
MLSSEGHTAGRHAYLEFGLGNLSSGSLGIFWKVPGPTGLSQHHKQHPACFSFEQTQNMHGKIQPRMNPATSWNE